MSVTPIAEASATLSAAGAALSALSTLSTKTTAALDAAAGAPPEVFLTFILMLSIFLGFELITKVPSTLHTPLMSGSNAISGITLVGAVSLAGSGQQDLANYLGAGAVALASINVAGGYLVTDRMLAMFKKRGKGAAQSAQADHGTRAARAQNGGGAKGN